MDLFRKCEDRGKGRSFETKRNVSLLSLSTSQQAPEVKMDGKEIIMIGSNNYLGLTSDEEVVEAGILALQKYGSGCSGSRFLNGTLDLHLQLEENLAKFLQKEAVVTFSTGFQSNLGIIAGIVGRNDVILCDRKTMPAFTTLVASVTAKCCVTTTAT